MWKPEIGLQERLDPGSKNLSPPHHSAFFCVGFSLSLCPPMRWQDVLKYNQDIINTTGKSLLSWVLRKYHGWVLWVLLGYFSKPGTRRMGWPTQEILELRAQAGKSPKGNQGANTRNGNRKNSSPWKTETCTLMKWAQKIDVKPPPPNFLMWPQAV